MQVLDAPISVEKLRPSYTFGEKRLAQLKQIVPEAFEDGQLNPEALRALLGDHATTDEDQQEHFGLSWPGKRAARRLASKPSKGTLVPQPGEGINEDNTDNVFIEGDNLEVLKLLQTSYGEQVKLIYIDPPYNTGNDFLYNDDYSESLRSYLERTGRVDEDGNLLSTNTKAGGRFHSNWLNMMYPRLVLARQLLREDGVIMVSIDDEELQHLRALMDEVFGPENFIANVIWQKVYAPKNSAKYFSEDHDYIVVYSRSAEIWRPNLLPRSAEADARYINPDDDSRGSWKPDNLLARNYYSKGEYEVEGPTGKSFSNPTGTYWRTSKEKFVELDEDNRIWWGEDGNNMPAIKRFLSEVKQGIIPQTLWTYKGVGHTQKAKKELLSHVDFQNTENVLNTLKPTKLIKRMLQIATDPDEGDIVMDFFCGSGTTAHATLAKNHEDGGNRRFVMVQLPVELPDPEDKLKAITDIAKERIRSVSEELQKNEAERDLGFTSYRLADSNYKDWQDYEGENVQEVETLFDQYETPLVDGWKREDLLTEILLMQGYPLSSTVAEADDFPDNDVRTVTTDFFSARLFVCLDDKIAGSTARRLSLSTEDTFVCLDSALCDEMKMRLSDAGTLKVI